MVKIFIVNFNITHMKNRWGPIKTIIFFLLLGNFFSGCQQQKKPDHFTINGKLSNLKDTIIYMMYTYRDSSRVDSAVVKNGSFTFHGKLTEPSAAMIFLPGYKGGGAGWAYIENGEMSLSGNADSINDISLSGSAAQDQDVLYKESTKSINKEIKQAIADYETAKNNNDLHTQIALNKKIEGLEEQKWQATKKFIRENPKSYVGTSLLGGWAFKKDYNSLFQLYSILDTSIQHSYAGNRLSKSLEKLKKIGIGSTAEDFVKNDLNGKPVKLSGYRGKWVLLDFWASWCGPCRAENPNVLKNYNAYKEKGFTVLGVSLDDSAPKWKKAVEEDKMPWAQVCSFEGWKDPVSREYDVAGIPANFLISPQGIVLARDLRDEELGRKLQLLIGE